MPAFLVVQIEVVNKEKYDSYKQMVPPSLLPYGGRFVVRGGKLETLEGTWSPERFVIIEFPSVAQAKAWWNSPEYAHAKAIRQESARTQLILVEGV